MPKMIVLQGLSGMGKSTLAAHLAAKGAHIISPDAIRLELTGDAGDQSRNSEVFGLAYERTATACKLGLFVVIDATVTRRTEYNGFASIGEALGYKVTLVSLPCDLLIAAVRNSVRQATGQRFVPDDILIKQFINLNEFDYRGIRRLEYKGSFWRFWIKLLFSF